MPRAISWRRLIQNFRKLGFEGPHSGGRHLFMEKGVLKVHIPSKHTGDISAGLVSEILRQAGIDKKEWDNI
ncbi:type II toxin-antitoxin system HicA family toxin [Patescibacteria group bacterium]|nr:type II toxin-antitoxin system HicA family toxin [Patescibacteria group bacterium]MBU2264781.1 type II toxin-antitoxin system HicA family toxin [Patescibacteria group bacterium]